jgi:hypothetical protein
MKFVIKLKGGKGSGHFGHSGRPGKRGGSAPGGGKPIPVGWPWKDIQEEDRAARDLMERMGNVTYTLGGVKVVIYPPKDKAPAHNWQALHPKAMHNYKAAIERDFRVPYDKIPDDIAEKFGKTIYTYDDTYDALREAGLKPRRRRGT